jgi:hypothetical protein
MAGEKKKRRKLSAFSICQSYTEFKGFKNLCVDESREDGFVVKITPDHEKKSNRIRNWHGLIL